MEDSTEREQRPHEKIHKRQTELIQKYPKLKPILMDDPIAYAWLQNWSRTDISIEEGLVNLVIYMQKSKKEYFKRLEDCMTRNPGHSFRAI